MRKRAAEAVYQQAWRNFVVAHARLIDCIDRELTAAGALPLHWYDVLVELDGAPDRRLRLHELADRVVLSRSGLTRLIDKLEAARLLRRAAAADDGRGALAVLTEKGRDALAQAWPIYSAGIARHFSAHLTAQQAEAIRDGCARLIEASAGAVQIRSNR